MSIKKHLNFFESLYKKTEKIPLDFLIDEIDVDSFFSQFFKIFQNIVFRLSKGLFGKFAQSKSLLLIHKLRIKVLNLRLN